MSTSPAPQEEASVVEPGQSLGGRLKAAGQLAAKQAQRAKLATITLPGAYRTLGKHLYRSKAYRDDFPDLYGQFEQLATELKSIRDQAAARPTAEGFTAKAKATAAGAKDMAYTKALELKTSHAFTELGKTAFEKFAEGCASAEFVDPISDARLQLIELDADIASLGRSPKGQVFTPKRLLVGVAVVMLMGVIGAFLPKGASSPSGSSSISASPGDHRAIASVSKDDSPQPVSNGGSETPEAPQDAEYEAWAKLGDYEKILYGIPEPALTQMPAEQRDAFRACVETMNDARKLAQPVTNDLARSQAEADFTKGMKERQDAINSSSPDGIKGWVFQVSRIDRNSADFACGDSPKRWGMLRFDMSMSSRNGKPLDPSLIQSLMTVQADDWVQVWVEKNAERSPVFAAEPLIKLGCVWEGGASSGSARVPTNVYLTLLPEYSLHITKISKLPDAHGHRSHPQPKSQQPQRMTLDQIRAKNKQNKVTPSSLTKKEFIEKMKQTMARGRIDDFATYGIFENFAFQDVFGDPDSNVEWTKGERLFMYRCADGKIQLRVNALGPTILVNSADQY